MTRRRPQLDEAYLRDLVQRTVAGEARARDQLAGELLAMVRGMLARGSFWRWHRHDEDFCQDLFSKLWCRFEKNGHFERFLARGGSLEALVFVAVQRIAIDESKRLSRERDKRDQVRDIESSRALAAGWARPSEIPASEFVSVLRHCALNHMSEPERRAMQAMLIDDRVKWTDIRRILGVPTVDAAKGRIAELEDMVREHWEVGGCPGKMPEPTGQTRGERYEYRTH